MNNQIQRGIITFIPILLFTIFLQAQCINPIPTGSDMQTFCDIDNKTVGDIIASGTQIVWFDAPAGGVQYDPSALLLDQVYYADDISGNNCSTERLAVTVSILGSPPTGVNVTASICANDIPTIADLSANGSNIQWFDSQFNGNLLSTNTELITGEIYWVQQTENGCTSIRKPTMITLVEIAAPEVSTTQSFCSSTNATVADLIANTVSSGNSIIWYADEMSTTPLDTTESLINGEDYWASQYQFPCESTSRMSTTVQIDIQPTAGTSVTFTDCDTNITTLNLYNLLEEMPDTNGSWSGPSTLSGGYLGVFNISSNNAGTYTYTVLENGVCSGDSATVTVTINSIATPTTTNSTQQFCESDLATISDLTVEGTSIQWYNSLTSSTPLSPTDALIGGTYYATQTDDTTGCESLNRLQVDVVVNVTNTPTTTNSTQQFCESDLATISDLTVEGTSIQWYNSLTSSTPLSPTDALIGGTYYATQTDETTDCESLNRLQVDVVVNVTNTPITTNSTQQFCESDLATISDLVVEGTSVQWYNSLTSSAPLPPTDALIGGAYFATQTDDATGCESLNRLKVDVEISTIATPTITINGNEFCEQETNTLLELESNISVQDGGTLIWYDTYPGGTPLDTSETLINDKTYYAIESDGTCQGLIPLEITVVLSECYVPVLEIYDGFSPSGNGINDTFVIKDIELLYPDYKIEFFNRWGNLMYVGNINKPAWNGKVNGTGETAPVGVYFYIIYFNKDDLKPKQGRLYLNR